MLVRRHPLFQFSWCLLNVLLVASAVLLVYGIGWEISTERYLKGFADSVVPLSTAPEQKVEAILTWMNQAPARRNAVDVESLDIRDPQTTLNYQRLLQICGSATNAFVNLASSSGLEARRLLLLNQNNRTLHVVAEVRLAHRWVVIDPAFRAVFRDAQGQPLTRSQLRDPHVFREATQKLKGYPPACTFDRTTQVRLERIPFLGGLLRKILNALLFGWEEWNWSGITERTSMALTLAAALLMGVFLAGRFALSWYGKRRLGVIRVRLREQLMRAAHALFSIPS